MNYSKAKRDAIDFDSSFRSVHIDMITAGDDRLPITNKTFFDVIRSRSGSHDTHFYSESEKCFIRYLSNKEIRLYKAQDFDLFPVKQGYVVAVFTLEDKGDGYFDNGMFVGKWEEAYVHFTSSHVPVLKEEFSNFLLKFSSKGKANLMAYIQGRSDEKIDELRTEYKKKAKFIRTFHRRISDKMNQSVDVNINALDEEQSAEYYYEMDGFAPSKIYQSYSKARRSFSKRNMPYLDCKIVRTFTRNGKVESITFATWSPSGRLWNVVKLEELL